MILSSLQDSVHVKMMMSQTSLHALDSILDDAIHLVSRKRPLAEMTNLSQPPIVSNQKKKLDQKAIVDFLSVGEWNSMPDTNENFTVTNLTAAAHTLGLPTKTSAPSSPSSAVLSPRSASELDWDFVFGVCSSDSPSSTPPAPPAKTQRKSNLFETDKSAQKAVADFLAVGAWNDLEEQAPTNEELQRASVLLGLPNDNDNSRRSIGVKEAITWNTVEALISEPMHTRAPSPSSKLAAASKTMVATVATATAGEKKMGAAHGEVTFGSFSSDCIAGALL
jgi:hypothetical protein